MSAATATLRLALLGNPNCGKTALFNLLTGSRQKVANYPGVTVDRKEGQFTTPAGRKFRVLDLPGAYSLNALSIDETWRSGAASSSTCRRWLASWQCPWSARSPSRAEAPTS